jgi:hypothetical protein
VRVRRVTLAIAAAGAQSPIAGCRDASAVNWRARIVVAGAVSGYRSVSCARNVSAWRASKPLTSRSFNDVPVAN